MDLGFEWIEAVATIGRLFVAGSVVYFLYLAVRFSDLFAAASLDLVHCFLRRVCRQGGDGGGRPGEEVRWPGSGL